MKFFPRIVWAGTTSASQPPIHKPISIAQNASLSLKYSHVIHMSFRACIIQATKVLQTLKKTAYNSYTYIQCTQQNPNVLTYVRILLCTNVHALFSFWVCKPLTRLMCLSDIEVYNVPRFWYKLMHAQLVCTRLCWEGPENKASLVHTKLKFCFNCNWRLYWGGLVMPVCYSSLCQTMCRSTFTQWKNFSLVMRTARLKANMHCVRALCVCWPLAVAQQSYM